MQFIQQVRSSNFIERRKSHRNCSPLTTVIGNTPYAIANWSFCGMKIASYYGVLQPPKVTKLKILVPTTGSGALFQTSIEAIRYDPSDISLSVKFQSLNISNKATLRRYFQEQLVYHTEANGI
ncbi:hypothetical protein N8248_01010 [Rhodospirillaceae bacterium]|nr:hypothetical protein [Alphaproteobacteria bacterium]MDC1441246.1 hypothetical protein [Rhodospirillaceae bacterium]